MQFSFITKYEVDETIDNVICPHCGQVTSFTKIKLTQIGKVLGIPIIKTTLDAYVMCRECGTVCVVRRKDYKKIENGKDVEYAITDYRKEIRDKYGNGFSNKNQALAVFLSIFTLYGAPFFYLGRPLYGLLCIIYSFVMVMLFANGMMVLPFWFALGFGGIIYGICIGLGKCKDKDGKYILSSKQQKTITRETVQLIVRK